MQKLANELGIDIDAHHFPPGTSKWNKTERRLFSFISMNWQTHPLFSYQVIVDLIGSTTTEAAPKVLCELDPIAYAKGVVVTDQDIWTTSTSGAPTFMANGITPSNGTLIRLKL